MIVYLASYPRSGNTYLRMCLHLMYGVNTYSRYNDPKFVDTGLDDLMGQLPMPLPWAEMEAAPEKYFVKVHDMPMWSNPRGIYLVRNKSDVYHSLARYMCDVDECGHDFDYVLSQLEAGLGAWGAHQDHVAAWLSLPGMVKLDFSKLCNQPIKSVKSCLQKLGIHMAQISSDIPTFDVLHSQWPKFFVNGQLNGKHFSRDGWRT